MNIGFILRKKSACVKWRHLVVESGIAASAGSNKGPPPNNPVIILPSPLQISLV